MKKDKFLREHSMHREKHVKRPYGRRTERGENNDTKKAYVAGEASEKARKEWVEAREAYRRSFQTRQEHAKIFFL